jgi:hypothetical protein
MTDYDKIIVTYSEDMGCETTFNQEIKISECAFKKKSQVISECFKTLVISFSISWYIKKGEI